MSGLEKGLDRRTFLKGAVAIGLLATTSVGCATTNTPRFNKNALLEYISNPEKNQYIARPFKGPIIKSSYGTVQLDFADDIHSDRPTLIIVPGFNWQAWQFNGQMPFYNGHFNRAIAWYDMDSNIGEVSRALGEVVHETREILHSESRDNLWLNYSGGHLLVRHLARIAPEELSGAKVISAAPTLIGSLQASNANGLFRNIAEAARGRLINSVYPETDFSKKLYSPEEVSRFESLVDYHIILDILKDHHSLRGSKNPSYRENYLRVFNSSDDQATFPPVPKSHGFFTEISRGVIGLESLIDSSEELLEHIKPSNEDAFPYNELIAMLAYSMMFYEEPARVHELMEEPGILIPDVEDGGRVIEQG